MSDDTNEEMVMPEGFEPEDTSRSTTINLLIVGGLVVLILVLGFFILTKESSDDAEEVGNNEQQAEETKAPPNPIINAYDEGDFYTVLQILDRVIEQNNSVIGPLLFKAQTILQQGSLEFNEQEAAEEALIIINKALEIDPDSAGAYYLMGYAYEISQNYTEAFTAYNTSIDLDPSARAYSGRAHANDLFGLLEEARNDYEAALALDPNLDHALVGIARIYLSGGNTGEAQESLNKALNVSENKRLIAEAEQLLGIAEIIGQNFSEAKTHFDTALEYDNTLAAAWVGNAEAKYGLLLDSSQELFQIDVESILRTALQAITINPNQTTAYRIIGRTYYTVGDSVQAERFLNLALSVLDNDITLSATDKEVVRDDINRLIEANNT